MKYRNSVSLEEWFERARRGTSGDMVFDILSDWKLDRDELLKQIKNLISKSSRQDKPAAD